ncbi:MAG: hypothetical protein ABIN67_04150 [Ferruginibacter sp.]
MRNNKFISRFFLYCVLIQLPAVAKSQEEFTSMPTGRGQYALVSYVGGGLGMYAADAGTPQHLQTKLDKIKANFSMRIMWHPDHLLRFGLETGYMTFYSYTLTDSAGQRGKAALRAVPMLVEWSMALTRRFNIFAGSGIYLLTTDLNYITKTKSHKVSVGWMAAASYILPVSKNMGLGMELKYMDAAETSDGSIAFQLQWVWKFTKW